MRGEEPRLEENAAKEDDGLLGLQVVDTESNGGDCAYTSLAFVLASVDGTLIKSWKKKVESWREDNPGCGDGWTFDEKATETEEDELVPIDATEILEALKRLKRWVCEAMFRALAVCIKPTNTIFVCKSGKRERRVVFKPEACTNGMNKILSIFLKSEQHRTLRPHCKQKHRPCQSKRKRENQRRESEERGQKTKRVTQKHRKDKRRVAHGRKSKAQV